MRWWRVIVLASCWLPLNIAGFIASFWYFFLLLTLPTKVGIFIFSQVTLSLFSYYGLNWLIFPSGELVRIMEFVTWLCPWWQFSRWLGTVIVSRGFCLRLGFSGNNQLCASCLLIAFGAHGNHLIVLPSCGILVCSFLSQWLFFLGGGLHICSVLII